MKIKRLAYEISMNQLLERRLEKAFKYALRKGLPPVDYMRNAVDMLINHLNRMRINNETSWFM